MNYLNIKMNSKKSLIYPGKLVLGEKFDHNIYSLKFTIPDEFKQNNNYVVFYNTEHNIRLTYKLDENDCVNITANITQHPIEYRIFLVMCKTENMEDENNIVCVSEDITGTVKDNILTSSDDIEDDTDSLVIFLNSDLYTLNQSLNTINDTVLSIKNELTTEIIASNEEIKTTVEQIQDKLNELSSTIVNNLTSKIEEIKTAIDLGDEEILEKLELMNTNINNNNSLIVEMKNKQTAEEEFIDEINTTLTDVLYN